MTASDLIDGGFDSGSACTSIAGLLAARVISSRDLPAARFQAGGRMHTDCWGELAARVHATVGLLESAGVPDQGCVAIMLPTGYPWVLVDCACLARGWISSVYHVAWKEEEIRHALTSCRPDVIVCDDLYRSTIEKLLQALGWTIPCLGLSDLDSLFDDVEAADRLMTRPVSVDDPSTIVFTSGTHGRARGVMLTQNAILRSACHAYHQLGFDGRGCHTLHWLPFSHMFGRLGIYLDILAGATLHFNDDVNHLVTDMARARPQILFAVPRMLSRVRNRIEEQVMRASLGKRFLYRGLHGLGRGLALAPVRWRVPLQVWLRRLFPAVHARLGGALEVIVVGGAPVDMEDKRYFEALGVAVREGFGMTETAGVAAVQPLLRPSRGAGHLLPGVEARLDEQGQLLLRGASLLKSYLEEEAYDHDGWFGTGDLADLDRNGNLRIIGRIKDLIIPETGENVSPAKLEALLGRSAWVMDACVVGDGRPCLIALISLSAEGIEAHRQLGSAVFSTRLDEMLDGINGELPKFERIQAVVVVPDGFQVDRDEMTVTHKLRKKVILQRRSALVDACYERLSARVGRSMIPEPGDSWH